VNVDAGGLLVFASADDVGAAITIEIGEDGVFGGTDLADSGEWPGGEGADLFARRVVVDADGAALFPTGGDVGKAVAIDVGQADAVGACE
jgi:hypothetical protein